MAVRRSRTTSMGECGRTSMLECQRESQRREIVQPSTNGLRPRTSTSLMTVSNTRAKSGSVAEVIIPLTRTFQDLHIDIGKRILLHTPLPLLTLLILLIALDALPFIISNLKSRYLRFSHFTLRINIISVWNLAPQWRDAIHKAAKFLLA